MSPVIHYLLPKETLDVLSTRVADLPEALDAAVQLVGPMRTYPDGAVEFCFNPNARHQLGYKWATLVGVYDTRMRFEDMTQTGWYVLPPFGREAYMMFYPSTYQRRLGTRLFNVMPNYNPEQFTSAIEIDLDRLPVVVVFRKRPNSRTKHCFALTVLNWSQLVEKGGVFGEGRIRLLSKEIEFRDRAAVFFIDAGDSGQSSINSLTLAILSFGFHTATTVGVQYSFMKPHPTMGDDFTTKYWELDPLATPESVSLSPMLRSGPAQE